MISHNSIRFSWNNFLNVLREHKLKNNTSTGGLPGDLAARLNVIGKI